MGVSLHPRHPADVRAANKEQIKNRPSILRNNTRLQVMVVLPAITTAIAVYIALFFVNRVLRRYAEESGWGAPAAESQARKGEVFVRDVDGVVPEPVFLEQTPPPSPERVVEEYYRRQNEAEAARRDIPKPVLMPDLEMEPIPLGRIELSPLGMPEPANPLSQPEPHTDTASSNANGQN